MPDQRKAHHDFTEEIAALKERIRELEATEAELRRTQKTLEESTAKYRLLAEKTNDIAWIRELDLRTLYISPSIEKLLGFTPEERVLQGVSEQVTPASLSVIHAVMQRERFLEEQGDADPDRTITVELEYYHKDGSTRWGETIVSGIRNDRGELTGIHGVTRGITDRKKAEEALRESEEKFRNLFEKAPEGILIARGETLEFINPALGRILGHPVERLISEPFVTFIHPDDQPMVLDRHRRRMRGESVETGYDVRVIASGGRTKWVTLNSQIIDWEGVPANLSFITDITERKQAEEALRESEEKYRTLVESAGDIVFTTDRNGYFTFGNPVTLRITGYEERELIGKHFAPMIREDMREETVQFLVHQFAAKIPTTYLEYPILSKDGREVWFGQNTQLILNDDRVEGFQAVARDITEMREAKEQIRQMAYHDALTGLPNRLLFSDRLAVGLAQAHRNQEYLAVLMLDLDHFKEVNDTLGHDIGDLILKDAADRLRASLRKSDTVARFGGDEFVLILLDLKGEEDVIPVARKIVENFRKPFIIDTHRLTLTTSVGIALYPHAGTDETVLMKHADIAMYEAKRTGRDRYTIYKTPEKAL